MKTHMTDTTIQQLIATPHSLLTWYLLLNDVMSAVVILGNKLRQ